MSMKLKARNFSIVREYRDTDEIFVETYRHPWPVTVRHIMRLVEHGELNGEVFGETTERGVFYSFGVTRLD